MPGAAVSSWLGCFHSSFNTSAAAWETGTAVFETWLTNGGTPAIKVGQTLAFANTGSNTTWNGQAQLLTSRWITVLNGSHPGLILRIGIPMVASEADWDNLLAGTWDAQFSNFNQYIVNHDGDAAGGVARLIRLRIGWEMNLVDNAWGPRFTPTYPTSTYSKAKFREGWRRIAGLFATSRALGTKLVWNPATPHKSSSSWTPHTTSSLWPGDDNAGVAIPGFNSVDVIGDDAYDQWLTGPTTSQQTRWAAAYNGTGVGGEGIASVLALAAAENLPVSFDEWGIDLNTSVLAAPNQNKHSGDDDYYVLQMSQTMQTLIDAGRFDGHCYWDNNNNITSQLSPTTIGPLAAAQFLGVWGNANNWVVYNRAKKKMCNGTIALGVDVFKLVLVQSSSNFQTLALSTVGSLTNQVASAGGYVQAGLPMVVTWTVGASAGAYQFAMAPLMQTATGAGIVNIRAAVIKNSAGQLLCYANITTSQFAVPAGTVITLAPTAGGIFTLSGPISPVMITPAAGALAIAATAPTVTNSSGLNVLRSVRQMVNYGPVTPAGFYKEFGAHFAQGDVPQGSFVEVRQGDGVTVIPSQGDNFVRWPDNSLRSASMTMRYALSLATTPANGSSGTLKLYARTGAFNNTPWTSTAAITTKNIVFEVTLLTQFTQVIGTGDGTIATFSATLAGAPLVPGSVALNYNIGGAVYFIGDNSAGGWTVWPNIASGSINYATGAVSVTFNHNANQTDYRPRAGTPVNVIYAKTSDAGTIYTLGATNEIVRGNFRQVRAGPVQTGWRLFGEFRAGTGSSATPEGDIWGILYLNFFSDGTYTAWGTLQNGRFTKATAGAKIVGGYRIIDGVPLFNYPTAFRLFAGCPVFTCNTDGLHPYSGTSVDKCVVGFPTLTLGDSTTTGLYDSFCTWWNVSTPAMRAALTTTTPFGYAPNCEGSITDHNINGTGLHPFVSPMSGWSATAMLAQDWNALRTDRINAFTSAMEQDNFLDAGVGYPGNMSLSTPYPGLGAANVSTTWNSNTPTIAITGGGPYYRGNGPPADGSHAGNYAWYQYLATGQEPWLDMISDQAIGQLGWENGGNTSTSPTATRNPLVNGIRFYLTYFPTNQVRAGAWNLRNIGNAHWVTPDAHPMKPYLSDIETNTFALYAEFVRPPNYTAAMATLGVFFSSGQSYIAGWQSDYLMTSFALAIRRRRITTSNNFVAYHLVPWTLGRHLSPSCPWRSYSYHYGNLPGATPTLVGGAPGYPGSSFVQQWSDVWVGNLDPPAGALEQPITTGPSAGACPVSGLYAASNSSFAVGGSSYPNQGLVAVVMAMTVGMTNAAAAYPYIENEMVATGISEAKWADIAGCAWRIDTPR